MSILFGLKLALCMHMLTRIITSRRPLIALLCGVITLSACANHHDPFTPSSAPSQLYICDGGRQVVIAMRDQADYAALSFEGRNIRLKHIPASGRADTFSNDIYTLYFENSQAAVEREGVPVFTGCVLEQ